MGIFDAFKQVTNYLTGSGAEISLILNQQFIGSESRLPVTIYCKVKEFEILVDELYLEITAIETTRVRINSGNPKHQSTSKKTLTAVTYDRKVIIDSNFRLDPNADYQWESEIVLPELRLATYKGINARHEWKVRAGISKKGTDPVSPWVFFTVY